MAGTTTNFAIPYPTSTDYVTDGASAMRSLADQVDAVMFTGTPARNLLINGAMQVVQRNPSVASITTTNYYTADRYNTLINTLGTWTQSIENDAPTGSGLRKSIKNLCTVIDTPAAGDYFINEQVIEGQNLQAIRKGTSSAQQVVLSFWVKANKTGTYICQLRDDDNGRSVSKSYAIVTSGTWQYVSLVFPADTSASGVLDNDNAGSLRVRWWLAAGSAYTSGTLGTTWATETPANVAVGQVNLADTVNNYWQMTGAQLTVGAVAVPFQFKTFAEELLACQRYYQKSYNQGVNVGTITDAGITAFYGASGGFAVVVGTVFFKTTMRVAPTTITFWRHDAASSNLWSYNNFGTGGSGTMTPSSLYVGDNSFAAVGGIGSSNTIGAIYGHWNAVAEL